MKMSSITTATPEDVLRLRKEYPAGTRVRLVEMDDPYRKFPAGTLGTVKSVDDIGTIHVAWDNGCLLGVVYGVDQCEKVQEEGSQNGN